MDVSHFNINYPRRMSSIHLPPSISMSQSTDIDASPTIIQAPPRAHATLWRLSSRFFFHWATPIVTPTTPANPTAKMIMMSILWLMFVLIWSLDKTSCRVCLMLALLEFLGWCWWRFSYPEDKLKLTRVELRLVVPKADSSLLGGPWSELCSDACGEMTRSSLS